MPPVEPIKEWLEVKGLTPSKGTIESFAWAVATNIGKFGTKPPHFKPEDLAVIVERAYLRFQDRIADNMAEDTLKVFDVIFSKNGFKVKKA